MAHPATDFRIHRALQFNEVEWRNVVERLITRFHLEPASAKQLVNRFFEHFLAPLEPFWFRHPMLSAEYNRLVGSICEVHGADSITLEKISRLPLGPFSVVHQLRLNLVPTLKSFEEERSVTACRPDLSVSIFGSTYKIASAMQVVLWRLLSMFVAIALAVPFMGCLLYALFVFIIFLESPTELTITALNDGPIGLALLCFMVGVAGLFGRAVKNTVQKIREISARKSG